MTLNTDWRACGDDFDPTQDFNYGMLTHIVGMPEVTAENVDKFWLRVSAYERLVGNLRNISDGEKMVPYFYTREEIGTMVGFRTNVSPMTEAAFRKHAFTCFEREARETP